MKLIRTPLPNTVHHAGLNDLLEQIAADSGGFARWFGLPARALAASPQRVPVDLFETDHDYRLRFELPGFKKEEISVRSEGRVIKVSAERPAKEDAPGLSMSRAIQVPGPVDAGQITAKLEDGVLNVVLPRHEEAKPRRVAID